MFQSRRYLLELGGALLFHAASLAAAAAIAQAIQPTGAGRLALQLLPVLGAFAVAWAVLRGLRGMDELQRRIQLEAIDIAFLGTALLTFAWGFAEAAGLPQLRAFAVWLLMALLWRLGVAIARRRYR